MYCHQKHSGAVKGFLLGSLLIFSLMFAGSNWNGQEQQQTAQNTISFDEAVARLKADDIKEVRIKNGTAEFFREGRLAYASDVSERQMSLLLSRMNPEKVSFAPEAKDPLVYLFQILFWLFFISPPVIVVLLLVIIKKMDAKS